MKLASLVAKARNNILFEPGTGPNGGEYFLPWRMLKEEFAKHGIELNTADVNEAEEKKGRKVSFELHHNAQRDVMPATSMASYAYLYEDALVRPVNAHRSTLAQYKKVFTSNEALIDGQHILRLDYPNSLTVDCTRPYSERDFFCVMIASNKALLHEDGRGLHVMRVQAIRFFEAHAPDLFSLYGKEWDQPAREPGKRGRIKKRLQQWQAKFLPTTVNKRPFPSYLGSVDKKSDVLDRAKFSICYENSRGAPGYVTEKIFDCFRSGTVPVYLGNMGKHSVIPAATYINRDHFSSDAALLDYLKKVTPQEHEAYQEAAATYLKSSQAQWFGNENFCKTLVREIVKDFSHKSL
jgi:alpha(1,3/1,4) fucosyltransferase